MQAQAKFRVLQRPFTITGRGVAVIGEIMEGSIRFAQRVTVSIPGGPNGDLVEEAIVEAARLSDPPHELPGLVFTADAHGEHAALLRSLLTDGAVLSLSASADAAPAGAIGNPAPRSVPGRWILLGVILLLLAWRIAGLVRGAR